MAKTSSPDILALEARAQSAAKLYSPSATRNSGPIREVLTGLLPEDAHVLEVGSGTGEHGEAVCMLRPDIRWTPSDPDPDSRASQSARSIEIEGLQNPLALDLTSPDWSAGLGVFNALICCNVIHISPWDVAENLAQAADSLLESDGFVFLYGPYLEGNATASSNLQFDASLRVRNPQWGVRALDAVTDLFARYNFELTSRIDMPANNLSLVFQRLVK
ncbi:DUF938 domain-containing protein [Hyphobacterium sp.]|uniref:DUF938 domain-containing protein n=1 Tax=Hyphobacterium sp. TaxID=2004662 RepID=UPI003BAAD59F